MLGFYPIADAPLAVGPDANPAAVASQSLTLALNSVSLTTTVNADLSSQTLTLTENSVSLSTEVILAASSQTLLLTENSVTASADANFTLASQTLTLTENSIIVEVSPPTFDSQSIALTVNSATVSAAATAPVESQSLLLTENSVAVANSHNIAVNQEIPMLSTLNNVGLSLDAVLVANSQQINFTLNSVSLITDQYIVAPSQTIYTTLNRLREWLPINTAQPGSCTDGIDGQWTDIPFDTEVFGDDFAIASEPLCALPQPLPPIRKFPGTPWANVPAQTTTTWSNIQT